MVTHAQLTRLWDELQEFRSWIDDQDPTLGLFDALIVVSLAVWFERERAARAEA